MASTQDILNHPRLKGLNTEQRAAVTHGDGPLLVVAGAGTGKTQTLVGRLAWLICQSVAASSILLLTFTRRAAAEMVSRARELVGTQAGNVCGGTFHSAANRLLRKNGQAIGLDPGFTIIDQGDAADLMNFVRGELGVAKGDRRFPQKQTLIAIHSRVVSAREPLTDVLRKHFPWCERDRDAIATIFDAYVERKRGQNVLDYDDLLASWNALASTPGVGDALADQFEHILVDELQDTNIVQAEILQNMRRRNNNIMVVGDDAQSIYSFRGATVRNMLDFPKQFPGTTIIKLEQNYRSTQPILAASNAVMAQAKETYTKNLWSDRLSDQQPVLITCTDESNEADVVCDNILAHHEQGIPLTRQAVLFRAAYHSAVLEAELSRRNIPFVKFGGLKFVEAAHIKDVIALLRVLENPHDEMAWFRILQLLDGIGPKTARRIMNALGVHLHPPSGAAAGPTSASPLSRLADDRPEVPKAARQQFASLCQALIDCDALQDEDAQPPTGASSSGTTVASQVERLRPFYEPILEQHFENAPMRLNDIEQLELIASRYRSRRSFINVLALDPPDSTADLAKPDDQEDDCLVLSTIHSAKGREWDVVHILHTIDGMIPSDRSLAEDGGLEEERRVFNVGMTRAKDWLYVCFPLRLYRHRLGMSDEHGYAQLTRFLDDSAVAQFERRVAIDQDGDALPTAIGAIDGVDEEVRALW